VTKECPMCGDWMRVHTVTEDTRIPGTNQRIVREIQEWRCAECDYFEEFDADLLGET
jgi:YgiT-type zinc finger domain-containing protein